MSIVSRFIAELVEIEEAELSELERIVRQLRLRRPFHPVMGRFSGPWFANADGEIIMSAQQLIVGQPYTGGILFTDETGATGHGPIGIVSASDPSVVVSLSADGQSVAVEMTDTLVDPATISWSDPAGVIPSFSMDVTDAAVIEPPPPPAFVPVSGAFGTLEPAA